MDLIEASIDGLVGPTHNYAGLSFGNVASKKYAQSVSNPQKAALQGLRKMKFVHDLGIPQLVMAPQPRPDFRTLYNLGFKKIEDTPADILAQTYSASSMWVANAATISPSADTADGKVHITPANLLSMFHRSIETKITAGYLKQLFPSRHFVHHAPLAAHAAFSDEGAANHMRLSTKQKSIEIFVYGGVTHKYPGRQTLRASQSIARLHQLDLKRTLFLCQNPGVIDKGVFHNDVSAMSAENIFIYHEKAYSNLRAKILREFSLIPIKEKELSVEDAVATYFFNSQVVNTSNGIVIIAPEECHKNSSAKKCFSRLIDAGHIKTVHYFDLRESMKNGGGPACLRLRVPLTKNELKTVNAKMQLNDHLYKSLCQWIEKYFRDRITPNDLYDPLLAKESQAAMEALYHLLDMKAETA